MKIHNSIKPLLLMLLIASSLISIVAAGDAKAIAKCESLSQTTNISNLDAVKTAKTILKCLNLTLDADVKSRLELLKTKLPTSVRNAVFLKDVCIKNKQFNEYLYVPETGFQYDNERRRLFTWIGSNWQHDKGDFSFVPSDGNDFFIVSTNHHEYLFAAGDDYLANSRRRVFTWEPDWEDERAAFNERLAMWELEPVGDTGSVYIKNRQYQDYFYAGETDMAYDNERRNVFAWKGPGCYLHEQCIWDIVSC